MNTGKSSDDLARVMQDFEIVTTETLQGRRLSREQVDYFQAHPQEWHRRMFDLLMASLGEARTIYNLAMEIMLMHATRVPASELSRVLGLPNIFGPDLEKIVNYWKMDRDRAYEEFGVQFSFPPPSFPDEKRSTESAPR